MRWTARSNSTACAFACSQRCPAMDIRRLADLQVDAQHGIEGAQGILRDEGDAAAAQAAARGVGRCVMVSPPSVDLCRPRSWRGAASGPGATGAVMVLPLPDSPITPTISPGHTSRLTSSMTRARPRRVAISTRRLVDRQARRPVAPAMAAHHDRPTRADAGRRHRAGRRPAG